VFVFANLYTMITSLQGMCDYITIAQLTLTILMARFLAETTNSLNMFRLCLALINLIKMNTNNPSRKSVYSFGILCQTKMGCYSCSPCLVWQRI